MSELSIETIRHSAAHIMAAAVKELYEDVREEREIQEEVSVKSYGDLYTEADVRVRVYFDFDRYNLTEDDFHRISDCYGMDTSMISPNRKRFCL